MTEQTFAGACYDRQFLGWRVHWTRYLHVHIRNGTTVTHLMYRFDDVYGVWALA